MTTHKTILFFDVSKGKTKLGRIKFQLWQKQLPKICENFRQLCTGQYLKNSTPTGYKQSCFYQITTQSIKGGDYIKNTGQSCQSIYQQNFYEQPTNKISVDQNVWIICMIKKKQKYNSLFQITYGWNEQKNKYLQPFGQVIQQNSSKILKYMIQFPTSENTKKIPFIIYDCGEM